MKLKYYLRGMGIGIILTAIVMGFALGGRKATISDAEVIERAKALGMVDAGGVLSQNAASEEISLESQILPGSEETSDDSSASITSLDKEGEEISEKDHEAVAGASKSVSEVAKEETKNKDKKSEDKKSEDSKKAVSNKDTSSNGSTDTAASSAAAATSQEEVKTTAENTTENKQQEVKASEANTSVASTGDTTAPESANTSTSVLGSTTSVTKTVTIPGGLGSDQVSQILYREGIIDNAVAFNNYLIDRKMDRIIRSGVKTIPAGSSYEDIARIICKG